MNATIILDSRVIIDGAIASQDGNQYFVSADVSLRDIKAMTKAPVTMVLTDGESLEEVTVNLTTYDTADAGNGMVREFGLVFTGPEAVDIPDNWLEEQEIPEKPARKKRTPRKSKDESEG